MTDPFTGNLAVKAELITEAIRRAVREAVVPHAKLGRAVPVARDGEVVWLSPDEILSQFKPVRD